MAAIAPRGPARVNGRLRTFHDLADSWRADAGATSHEVVTRASAGEDLRAWEPLTPSDRDAWALWHLGDELQSRVAHCEDCTVGELAERLGALMATWRDAALTRTHGRADAADVLHAEAAAYRQAADELRAALDGLLTFAEH